MGRRKNPDRARLLLDRCCDYVEEHGLGEVTLRPLAAGVGVSPRTLLYHFGSRQNLIIAIVRRSRDRRGLVDIAEVFAQLTVEASGKSARISSRVESIAKVIWEESLTELARPALLLAYEAYVVGLRHRDRDLQQKIIGETQTPVREFLIRAGVPPDYADITASQLVGTHRGLVMEWLATGRTAELTIAHHQAIKRIAATLDEPRRGASTGPDHCSGEPRR